MKDRYKSINCPICDKSLENSDVVVCPDCGAPYHRHCYMEEKQCIFPELHASGNAWKAPKGLFEPKEGDELTKPFPMDKLENTTNLCTRCGTVNPSTGVFCQICGIKLAPNPNNSPSNPAPSNSEDGFPEDKFEPSAGYMAQNGIPLNSIMNPLGGLSPNETIDGVTAKELAVFIGRSSHYYLPKFKELSQNKSKSINFAAFIFTGGFFLYRKMFTIGLLFCMLDLLFAIPSTILMYESMTTQMLSGATLIYGNQTLIDLNSICSFLITTMRFVCGFFANSIYKTYVMKKIKQIKSLNLPESEYFKTLAKQGSVAIGLIRLILFCYVTFYFFSILILIS